jgi:hypothetical protein
LLLLLFLHDVAPTRSKSHWWSRFRRKGDEPQQGAYRCHHYVPPYFCVVDTIFTAPFPAPRDSTGLVGYVPEDLERPRVPLIVLAQKGQYQPDYYPAPQSLSYDQEVDPDDVSLGLMSPDRHSRLSTITELTERTEPSSHWPSRQQLVAMNNPRAMSSCETASSYGKVIGESRCKHSTTIPLIYSQSTQTLVKLMVMVMHIIQLIQIGYLLPHLLQP